MHPSDGMAMVPKRAPLSVGGCAMTAIEAMAHVAYLAHRLSPELHDRWSSGLLPADAPGAGGVKIRRPGRRFPAACRRPKGPVSLLHHPFLPGAPSPLMARAHPQSPAPDRRSDPRNFPGRHAIAK